MARKEIYTCDSCGVERKESNHWFSMFGSWDVPERRSITISGFVPDTMRGIVHLCGEACLVKYVSQWAKKEAA